MMIARIFCSNFLGFVKWLNDYASLNKMELIRTVFIVPVAIVKNQALLQEDFFSEIGQSHESAEIAMSVFHTMVKIPCNSKNHSKN